MQNLALVFIILFLATFSIQQLLVDLEEDLEDGYYDEDENEES